jgi:hypothetical protein
VTFKYKVPHNAFLFIILLLPSFYLQVASPPLPSLMVKVHFFRSKLRLVYACASPQHYRVSFTLGPLFRRYILYQRLRKLRANPEAVEEGKINAPVRTEPKFPGRPACNLTIILTSIPNLIILTYLMQLVAVLYGCAATFWLSATHPNTSLED